MMSLKAMSYQDIENEIVRNQVEMRTSTPERKRELIMRNHSLMTELDRRWEGIKNWWK